MPSKSAQKVGWKDIQSKSRAKKSTKLALTVLGLMILLILLSQIVNFGKSLFSPLSNPAKLTKNYIWNAKYNINLLIRTKSIYLLSVNPKEGKIIIINMPDELYFKLPHGFGGWQLRSVYGLGGDKLLKDTMTDFLGLPMDGFLDFKAPFDQKSASQLVEILRKNPLNFNLLPSLQTDLTLWELIRLKMNIASVRFDKIDELSLAELPVLDKMKLLDGTDVLTDDPVKVDSILANLKDPTIAQEHKSIAVFNATDIPQLAQKAARLITNLGGNIIIITNAKVRLNNTQVIGDNSATMERLKQIFDLGCQKNPKCDRVSPSDEDLVSSRAQVNLFLGEDYSD